MENMLGVMLDCSRNAVMKVETVKKYAEIIRKMGYNTLMLYTEETYEIPSQPFFGHLRGRYSIDEIKDIDSYCKSIGIELVPCIQTLAHLGAMFKWRYAYDGINDCDDILLCGEEKTYELIEEMIKTLSMSFSSKKIHIGMDEAYRVGKGKYQDKHGVRDKFDVINEHLHRVCEIAEKYGFEPMIWSDMFCKLAAGLEGHSNSYGELERDAEIIREKAALPENISLVYWDYYNTNIDHYRTMIKRNRLFGRPVYFAGGAWTWRGFAPDNGYSIRTTEAALEACKSDKVDGMFITVWGDDGGECSRFAILPSLMYTAEKLRGNDDMESIKAKFREIVGIDFDSFTLLDGFDYPQGKFVGSACKMFLYNDAFMGMRDFLCREGDGDFYEKLADGIKNIENKEGFELLFDSYEKLARVLALKTELGIKTRKAYLAGDRKAVGALAEEYGKTVDRIREFHKAYQAMWLDESKPHGFDVQDIRLGGLIQRLLSCKERLEMYADGNTNEIPELSEPVLQQDNGCISWAKSVSANNI